MIINNVEIKKDEFEKLCASAGVYDVSTGLGVRIVGNKRFLFVKDSLSGNNCCYVQPRYNGIKPGNAHFVVSTSEDANKIFFNCSKVGGKEYSIKKSTSGSVDIKSNIDSLSGAGLVYERIKPLIAFGVVPAPIVGNIDKENVYVIEKAGKKDGDYYYLVVGPHGGLNPDGTQKKPNAKSLYLLPTLTKADGTDIDLTNPQEIYDNGGLVAYKVRYDNKGNISLKYYKAEKKLALFSFKGLDLPDCSGFSTWIKNYVGTNENELPKGQIVEVKSIAKSDLITKLCVGGATFVVAGAIALTPFHLAVGRDQSAEAELQGRTQIEHLMQNDENLFQYKDGRIIKVGALHEILNTKIETYKQKGFWGVSKKYPEQTLYGAGVEIGEQVALELLENKINVATYNPSTEKYDIIFNYPAEVDTNTNAFKTAESLRDWLKETGYTAEQIDAFVKGYEEGYTAIVEAEMAKEDSTTGKDETVEEPKVDYVQEIDKVKEAAFSTIAKNTRAGATFEAEDIMVVYSSADEKVVFATAGNFLFQIDLTDGGNNTTDIADVTTMLERIEATSTVFESVKAEALLGNLGLQSALEQLKFEAGSQKGMAVSSMYVNTNNAWKNNVVTGNKEITPTITYIYNDGAVIETEECDTVGRLVNNVSIAEGVAYAILPGMVNTNCVRTENVDKDLALFDKNDLPLVTAEPEVSLPEVEMIKE